MSDNYYEDPLESLLDSESDEEFGLPVFKDHLDKDQAPLVLKNWSAKDFSEIYVRFQPHLIRHAKRFLTNHAQAEEVVQDAFLYLMTSLPEIDSEIGALKLLKWKVRLLALDVISSNSKANFAPISEDFELEAEGEEVDQNLLRADEAAIVSLALAKLQPRQREVLIASIYEEKPTAVVASQLGLNENATRQLLLRSKNAFKRALIGEAETAGLSVPQILSIAARKASHDAGKYIAATSALLLALVISVGVIPNLRDQAVENVAAPAMSPSPNAAPMVESTTESSSHVEAGQQAANDDSENQLAPEIALTSAVSLVPNNQAASTDESNVTEVSPQESPLVDESPFDPWLADSLLNSTTSLQLLPNQDFEQSQQLSAVSKDLWADFRFTVNSRMPISNVNLGFMFQDKQYLASPYTEDFLVATLGDGTDRYTFIGRIDAITDTENVSYLDSVLAGTEVKLVLIVDRSTNTAISATVSMD